MSHRPAPATPSARATPSCAQRSRGIEATGIEATTAPDRPGGHLVADVIEVALEQPGGPAAARWPCPRRSHRADWPTLGCSAPAAAMCSPAADRPAICWTPSTGHMRNAGNNR